MSEKRCPINKQILCDPHCGWYIASKDKCAIWVIADKINFNKK